MRLPGTTGHKIFGFILAIGVSLTLPDVVGGAHSFGGSGRFRAPKMHRQHSLSRPFHRFGFSAGGRVGEQQVRRFRAPKIHRQHSFSRPFHRAGFLSAGGVGEQQVRKFRHRHPFHRFGFFGVSGVREQEVIIIQQFPPAPAVESREPAKNKIYVPPRWVDSGHGVQVLEPGYWTDAKQSAER